MPALAQKSIQLFSPDRDIVFDFRIEDSKPIYRVNFKGKPVVESSTLDLEFDGDSLSSGIRVKNVKRRDGVEEYSLVVGKTSNVSAKYGEVIIAMESKVMPVSLVVRTFNDGLAFRYEFPKSDGRDSLVITNEHIHFQDGGQPFGERIVPSPLHHLT